MTIRVILPAAAALLLFAISAASASCRDPMRVLRELYDANDAGKTDAALSFFSPEARGTTWMEGVNGRHWDERSYTGQQELRDLLSTQGLHRMTARPDSMRYRETNPKITGDTVVFSLMPDRSRPDGTPYSPFQVTATFSGCTIASLTVVEFFTRE